MNDRNRKHFILIQIFLIFVCFVVVPFLLFFDSSNNFLNLEFVYLYTFLFVLLYGIMVCVLIDVFKNFKSFLNIIKSFLKLFNRKWRKERKLLKNITIVPYYEPPSRIHPAIAGYLIDRKIGKREFYAVLFSLIVNGFIVIDEKINKGDYKYYLLKNKGFKKSISCDRLVSEFIFCQNGKNLDQIAFKDIEIDPVVLLEFAKRESIKLKYFEDSYYVPIESEKKINWLNTLDLKKMGINPLLLENRKPIKKLKSFYYNLYTFLGVQERTKWLGFKDYLQTAERFRMDKEKIETFSKYLPYAIALGVQTEWLKRFKNMKVNRLEWFQSQIPGEIKRHDKIYFKHLEKFLELI